MEKKRHGFVTFWLWLGIIGNCISIPSSIVAYQSMKNLGYLGIQLVTAGVDITPFNEAIGIHIIILQVVAAIAGICMIVFYTQLLKWKKSAFWSIVIVALAVAIINIVIMHFIQQDYALIGLSYNLNPWMQIIATPLSLLILWAVLQIRKDGVSCWSQLD